MSVFNEPIVMVVRTDGSRSMYHIILRPRYSWGYSEGAVGPVLLRDLRPLWGALRLAERHEASGGSWRTKSFDKGVWELHTGSEGSKLTSHKIVDTIRHFLAANLATKGGHARLPD